MYGHDIKLPLDANTQRSTTRVLIRCLFLTWYRLALSNAGPGVPSRWMSPGSQQCCHCGQKKDIVNYSLPWSNHDLRVYMLGTLLTKTLHSRSCLASATIHPVLASFADGYSIPCPAAFFAPNCTLLLGWALLGWEAAYRDVHEIVVRFLTVDLLDGDVADVAPIRLAHEDVVEAILLLPPVGALAGVLKVFIKESWRSAASPRSRSPFSFIVSRPYAPITLTSAPVFPLPGTCVRIHHDHNMVAAGRLPNRCI